VKEKLPQLLLPSIICAVSFSLCFPPFNLWFLAYFALIPIFYLLFFGHSARIAIYASFFLGYFLAAYNLRWLRQIFDLASGIVLWAIFAFFYLVFAVLVLQTRKRLGVKSAFFFAPFFWVAIEFFRSELWALHFPWVTPGFSQVASLPILQSASVIGIYGISFWVVSFNAALTFLFFGKPKIKFRVCYLGVLFGALGLFFFWGKERISQPLSASIPVGMVQYESHKLQDGLSLSEKLPQGLKLIAWPELSFTDFGISSRQASSDLSRFSKERSSILIAGGRDPLGPGENDFFNTAVLYSESGERAGRYVKGAPVPLLQDGQPGFDFEGVQTSIGRIGIGICYDLDNPYVIGQTVSNGAELLVVPTADAMYWSKIQHQFHALMGPARAVEYGRWIVRPASSGESQIVNPHGEVVTKIAIGAVGVAIGKVESLKQPTPYSKYGRILPWGSLAATSLLMLYFLGSSLMEMLRARKLNA